MNHRRFRAVSAAVALCLVGGGAALSAATTASAAPAGTTASLSGTYAGLAPARILDTRTGNGAIKAPLGAAKTLNLQVTGRGGVPSSGVGSVVLNLTSVGSTTGGWLSAYPYGTSRPNVSSINFAKGATIANLVTVRVGSGGKVSLYNNTGSVNVVADVVGYYNSSTATSRSTYGNYQIVQSERLFDSRTNGLGPLPGDKQATISVDYGDDINPHIRALAVNITAVHPTAGGHLTAWNGTGFIPDTSSLNYPAGRTVPNMQIVPVSLVDGYPQIGVANVSSGKTDLVVDIVGVYDDGNIPNGDGVYASRFVPRTSPVRIVDTRSGLGATTMTSTSETKVVTSPTSVAGYNTFALVTNTTAVKPSDNTVLTLWPNYTATAPLVSNLNPVAGQTVANMTITSMGPNNDFRMKNSKGTLNVLVDVAGTMEAYPAQTPSAARSGQADTVEPESSGSHQGLHLMAHPVTKISTTR